MAAFLIAMTGCQKEAQPSTGDEIAAGEKVYMAFRIQAVDTRSGSDGTSNDDGGNVNIPGDSNSDATPDFEIGSIAENTISNIQIVLKNSEKFIIADATLNDGTGAYKDTWVATFNSSSIAIGDRFDVYIYANCKAQSNLDATSEETIGNMTKANNFWMTNAYEPVNVEITALSTNIDAPTLLGEHYIERSMARFDYMAVNLDNTYDLTVANSGELQVTLTHAAIINQSKEFYYLRRATKGTTSTEVIGYPELQNNYVVDTDWDEKKAAYTANPQDFSSVANNFDYHINDLSTHINEANFWTSLSGLPEDNWDGTDDGKNHPNDDYRVFGYVKENTLPDVNSQVNGMSTGVIFKGQITGTLVTDAQGEDIYMFDNKLYGVWDNVVSAAANDEVLKHYTSESVFGDEIDDTEYEALAKAGFTRYTADTNGDYYTYYYYWNRHNDNGKPQEMGHMEFAVVRNNVYKLCVDYITKLGHPTPGTPDPDPIEPGDPDESGEYYFGVSVKVVPWVVRVNHIGW